MIELQSTWKNATDSEKWAARGATFMAKAKATKTVWFPPKPVESGKKSASKATKATKKATKKATGKATGKAGATAKKTDGGRRVSNPLHRTKK